MNDRLVAACRRECQQRRAHLGELESLAERLRADSGRLLASAGIPAVASGALRHDRLQHSLVEIETLIAAETAALTTAEETLKRLELPHAKRAAAAIRSAASRQPGRR